jgi:hypothetical protein
MRTSLEELRLVATRLKPLDVQFAFIGGAVLGLLVDDPQLSQVRRTKDVDVVVAILTYTSQARLEEQLRREGFRHDTSEGAPICRWIIDGSVVDIMPADSGVFGMNSRWFKEVLECAQERDLGGGCVARVVTPAIFIATKLSAFNDRGKGDYLLSRDLEDMVTVVDGRAAIIEEVNAAPSHVRDFIVSEIAAIIKHPDFHDALPGHMPAIQGAQQRLPLVRKRFEALACL